MRRGTTGFLRRDPRAPKVFLLGLVALVGGLGVPASVNGDWPQWRGPERDGTITGFQAPETWPTDLKLKWRVSVGLGHASPVQVGPWVYVFTREGDREFARCLSLADGAERWRFDYVSTGKLDDAVGRYGDSPRATPTVSDGRVFVLGAFGVLTALDAASGERLWQLTFADQFEKPYPEFGAAASPLVVDQLCIVPTGGKERGALAAFDVRTGRVRWSLADEGPGYASPVVLSVDSARQIVTQTRSAVVGVSPAGELLWRLPFKTAYEQNIITAVSHGGRVIFGGTGKPLAALSVNDGVPSIAWENDQHPIYMNSPVLYGDLVFGVSQREAGHAFCVDAKSGATIWKGPPRAGANVSVQRAGDVLVLLNERGELVFASAAADGYQVLAQYRVADSPVHAHPVLDGDHVLVKDDRHLSLWSFQ